MIAIPSSLLAVGLCSVAMVRFDDIFWASVLMTFISFTLDIVFFRNLVILIYGLIRACWGRKKGLFIPPLSKLEKKNIKHLMADLYDLKSA